MRFLETSALALAFVAGCFPQSGDSNAPVPADTDVVPAALGLTAFTFTKTASHAAVPAKVEAPVTLTASDGTGLELVGLKARGVVEGPLAFTELHLKFRNPEARVREGRFHITLPEGASISRFAMRIGAQWQEGEVVERQKARRVYEDFLHRRQDPALLEHAAGNAFSARVFPIPARAEKELIISYSHELPTSRDAYRLPLLGLPKVEALDIEIQLAQAVEGPASASIQGARVLKRESIKLVKSAWTPDRDFEIPVSDKGPSALRHQNLVVARVTPQFASKASNINGLTLLFDTSASRALGMEAQIRFLRELVAGLAHGRGAELPLRVVAYDQTTEVIFEGKSKAFPTSAYAQLKERGALGASDMEQALKWLSANTQKGRYDRLVLVTDGVITAGQKRFEGLIGGLRTLGFKRLDAVAMGGLRDSEQLRRLVVSKLDENGTVIDGDLPTREIASRLERATYSGVEVDVPGARWVWPKTLDSIQQGDEVLVYADLPEGQGVSIKIGDVTQPISSTPMEVTRPLLERAWVRARMARLSQTREQVDLHDTDMRGALKQQIVELSTRYRVLSPFTALLVLETENDYRRYGIRRDALADILTVGASGVTVLAERSVVRTKPQPSLKVETRSVPIGRLQDADGALESSIQGATPEPEAEAEEDPADIPLQEKRARSGGRGASRDRRASERERLAAPARPAPSVSSVPPPPIADDREPDSNVEVPPPGRRPRRRQDKRKSKEAVSGKLAEVRAFFGAGRNNQGLELALAWRNTAPGDVLALIALGEAFEKLGRVEQAARAYGSIIDLFPARADMLRFAAQRLEKVTGQAALELAIDVYKQAVAQRPDHPSGHRALALSLAKIGRFSDAFHALEVGLTSRYRSGFAGVRKILLEDLGLVAAAWLAQDADQKTNIDGRLKAAGAQLATQPSMRFVLSWETDANDVDFHIRDGRGGHAYYRSKRLPSGGRLYADITTGYGPECFAIDGAASAFPYAISAHYYRKGPMGYGMGRVQVVRHDGQGGLTFDERPFVVMNDGAFVDLGFVKRK